MEIWGVVIRQMSRVYSVEDRKYTDKCGIPEKNQCECYRKKFGLAHPLKNQ